VPVPRKILRIVTRLNVGGPSIQAIRLTTDLPPAGYATTLVHGRLGAGEGDMRELISRTDTDVRYLHVLGRPIRPLDDLRAFFAILAVLRQVRPDIVHTHMAKAGLVGRLAAITYNRTFGRTRPAQIVHTYHGHVLEGYFSRAASRIFVGLERQLGRHTDALIAVSPRIRTELVERFHIAAAGRFRTISLGFDLSSLLAIDDVARAAARASLDLPSRSLVLTTVGRLTAIKNHEVLIDAAERVAAACPDVLLLIVGDGELRGDLQRRAARLGDHVRFLGWRRDLATVYGASDVFVLTSRNEGTPVALIEAMASALPTVSTEVGGVADVVTDETMGLLVPAGDASALVAAVVKLLKSPDLRREMGARARASVAARYDIGRLLADIDALYSDLLQNGAGL
jgi:glycosyltransferase involved in cell wall biosynthesis